MRTFSMFVHARVDFGRVLLMGLIAAISLLSVSCMRMGTRKVAFSPAPSPTTANSNTARPSSSFDGGKYQELLNKMSELDEASLPAKLNPKAMIKGKVFVRKNLLAGARYDKYDEGISDYRRARNLEELETVIRILCSKDKFLGNYSKRFPGSTMTTDVKAYGIVCQVALIDYPARVIVAQKTFSNNEGGDTLTERSAGGEHVNPPPIGQIINYIDSFKVDKVMPTMTSPDVKELVRLPTTVDLKPDAAIRGKIKIVQKIDDGDLDSYLSHPSINGYDEFGFPYDRIANKTEELETLVVIVCVKGSLIGRVEKTTQYSSRCEVSLIDYKTLTVFAQKTIENKTLEETPAATSSTSRIWVVGPPKQGIESYLKSLPGALG